MAGTRLAPDNLAASDGTDRGGMASDLDQKRRKRSVNPTFKVPS